MISINAPAKINLYLHITGRRPDGYHLIDSLVAFAHRLADASGEVIKRYYRQPIAVDSKPDESPVTIADREAEAALRHMIETTYPDHGIVGDLFEIVPLLAEGAKNRNGN